ncbi:MAG: hypothetical protein ABFD79_08065 [Phycisphaerales bacterium]
MAIWYAHSSNANINAAGMWHTHPIDNTPVDFATCDETVILSANGKTGIRINTSFICKELTTVTQINGSAGGYFQFTGKDMAGNPTGSVKITGDVIGGTYGCIIFQEPANSTTPLEIEGDISSSNNPALVFQSSAYVTVNGNVTGGYTNGIQMMSGGSPYLTITGDVTGSSMDAVEAVFNEADDSTIVVNGNLTGGLGAAVTLSGAAINLIINGDVTGGADSSGFGINVYGEGCQITINGTCQGSDYASSLCCEASTVYIEVEQAIGGDSESYGLHFVNCDAYVTTQTAQGGSRGIGILTVNAPSNHITITEAVIGGQTEASYGFKAIGWLGVGAAVIKGNIIDTLHCNAYSGVVLIDNTDANYFQLYHSSTGNPLRKFPLQLPAESVKKGVQHGNIVGSLAPASPFRRLNRFV